MSLKVNLANAEPISKVVVPHLTSVTPSETLPNSLGSLAKLPQLDAKEKIKITIDAEWQGAIDRDPEKPIEESKAYKKLSPIARDFYKYFVEVTLQPNRNQYVLLFQALVNAAGYKQAIFFVDADLFKCLDVERVNRWIASKDFNIAIVPLEQSNFFKLNLVEEILELCEANVKNDVRVEMFYSPTDLRLAWGDELFTKLVSSKALVQKRNIKLDAMKNNKKAHIVTESGFKFYLHDAKGWATGSLYKFCVSTGIEMKAKNDLDQLKEVMIEAFLSETETSLEYSLGDVEDLTAAIEAFEALVHNVGYLIGLTGKYTLRQTVGALVAQFFQMWIYSCPDKEDRELFQYCVNKLGLIDDEQSLSKVQKDRTLFLKVTQSILDPNQVRTKSHWTMQTEWEDKKSGETKTIKESLFDRFNKIQFPYNGISSCRVQYFAHKHHSKSSGFNALVQGGRCFNERCTDNFLELVADIDLNSCYGSALRDFEYPVGLPSVLSYSENEQRMTLREFLKAYEGELVPGLYQIIVNTKEPLSFRQDLIFSKTTKLSQIRTAYNDNFKDLEYEDGKSMAYLDSDIDKWMLKENTSNIPGEFVLTSREINNGVITSYILETLRKVSTDKELGEFMDKLEVETAVLYKASDRSESIKDWCLEVVVDRNETDPTLKLLGDSVDSRTRAWVALPISGFIGNLIKKRNEVKGLKKKAVGDQKVKLSAEDEILKLFVNTTYGVLASPYFDIGNVVVANNITAKARLGVWMFNKALHTRQSITDGGMYTPAKVPYLEKTKYFCKPGFDALASNVEWSETKNDRKRGQRFKTLGDLDWSEIFQTVEKSLSEVSRLSKLSPMEVIGSDDSTKIVDYWVKGYALGEYNEAELALKSPEKRWTYLGGLVFAQLNAELGKRLDHEAMEHIKEFWSHYDLTLPFSIEHKGDNCGSKAAYWNKAHYAIKTLSGKTVFKVRGARQFKDKDWLKPHPMFELLQNILDGKDVFPQSVEYHDQYLLKIGQYTQALNSKEGSYEALAGLMPGDQVQVIRRVGFNNTHHHFETIRGLQVATTRKRYRSMNGEKVYCEMFEKYGRGSKGSITRVMNEMLRNSQEINKKY